MNSPGKSPITSSVADQPTLASLVLQLTSNENLYHKKTKKKKTGPNLYMLALDDVLKPNFKENVSILSTE